MTHCIKLLLTVLMLFNIQLPAFADNQEDPTLEIIYLIDQGLEQNFDLIKDKSKGLNSTQKFLILNAKKKDVVAPILLNMLVGFGMGTFIMGDNLGGLIELAATLLGIALLITPFFFPAEFKFSSAGTDTANAFGILGFLLITALRIEGGVRPVLYVNEYNQRLQDALGGRGRVSFSPYQRQKSSEVTIVEYGLNLKYRF